MVSEPSTPGERRLAAELELTRAIHATTIHDLGNPLQSLLVLVELGRDELAAREGSGRTVERLGHALDSIAQLRAVLLRATAVRAALHDPEHAPDWGRLLDAIVPFIATRLEPLRSAIVRDTAAIDAEPISPAYVGVRAATLALLLGVAQQLRDARGRGWTVHVGGDVGGRVESPGAGGVELRVGVSSPAGPVTIADSVLAQVADLLGSDRAAQHEVGVHRDAGELILRVGA